jgi:hypothetical protein
VTSSSVNDWLKDRWQAAMDMSGTSIEVCEGLGFSGQGLGFRLRTCGKLFCVTGKFRVWGLGFRF